MKKLLSYIVCISLLVIACEPVVPDGPDVLNPKEELGIIDFSFYCKFVGFPTDRIRRASLDIAYTADSLDHGLFFTSTNVSDKVSKYRMYLPEGTYYYQATIVCLCQGDSCLYAGFTGQNGFMASGGKVVVIKNEVTEVTTQFH